MTRRTTSGIIAGRTGIIRTTPLTQTVGQQRIGVIDSWEDSDYVEYSGDTASFTTQTTDTRDGSVAAECVAGSTGTYRVSSQSGLNRYPQAGDTFEIDVQLLNSGTEAGVEFGVQDSNNYYRATIDTAGSLDLVVVDGGSSTSLGSASPSISTGTWYTLEIAWGEGGAMTLTLDNASGSQIDQTSGTSAAFVKGGFGIRASNGASAPSAYYDIAEITATTSGTGVVEDWEDNDLSEYTGDTGTFDVANTSPYEGTYHGEGDSSVGVTSLSGLPRYPQPGDTFEFYMHGGVNSGDGEPYFVFAAQDGGNLPDKAYTVKLNYYRTPYVTLRKRDVPGTTVILATDTPSNPPPFDTYMRCVVEWGENGNIDLTVYDTSDGSVYSSISGVSTVYSGGGVGFFSGQWGQTPPYTCRFDTVEITASGDQTATGVVDSFEDQSLSEYTVARGTPGDSTIQMSNVKDGQYSLKVAEQTDKAHKLISNPGDGLPRYPEAGDKFRCWVRGHGSPTPLFPTLLFGVQDSDTYYWVTVNWSSNEMRIDKVVNGSNTVLASQSVSVTDDTYYEYEVQWDGDGRIVFRLFDENGTKLNTMPATDTEFQSGGIGFRVGDGDAAYFDNWRIIEN